MYEPKLIAPLQSGLLKYYKPFLIGDDAFAELTDCYAWRGVVKKREGTQLIARLPIWRTITTVVTGTVTTSTNHGLLTNDMVWIEGSDNPLLNNVAYSITVTGVTTFTLQDLNTGANITLSATGGSIYLPVVGLPTWWVPGGPNELLVIFHPKKAYLLITSGGPPFTVTDISFNPAATPISWSGTKDNFFWGTNYANALWVTNFVDVLRYWNGSSTNGWSDMQPIVNGATTLDTCLIVLPYKERLVVLNTKEGGVSFRQRARWSQIGTPYTVADATHAPPTPYEVNVGAWRDDIIGRGGFIDADTSEQIQTARIINDTLVVGFQYSTWRLRYTGNEILPFIWERISTSFGCEATYASEAFDEGMFELSRRGLVMSDTNLAERIDMKIPDQIDQFETGSIGEGLSRCWALRDFQKRLLYITYGDGNTNQQTPNKMLVYNYIEDNWAIFNISLTCMGRYRQTQDEIWSTWTSIWATDSSTWAEPIDQDNNLIVVGGRKDSNVIELFNDETTVDFDGSHYNFVIKTKQFNPYFAESCKCRLGYIDLYIESNASTNIPITAISQTNPIQITVLNNPSGLANGQQITLQSIVGPNTLNNFQYTISNVAGNTFQIANVNGAGLPVYRYGGFVVITSEVTVQDFLDDDDNQPSIQRKVSTSLDGTNNKYTRVYLDTIGYFHTLVITLSDGQLNTQNYPRLIGQDNQLADPVKGVAPFAMNGMVLQTRKMSRIKG